MTRRVQRLKFVYNRKVSILYDLLKIEGDNELIDFMFVRFYYKPTNPFYVGLPVRECGEYYYYGTQYLYFKGLWWISISPHLSKFVDTYPASSLSNFEYDSLFNFVSVFGLNNISISMQILYRNMVLEKNIRLSKYSALKLKYFS